MKHIIIFNPNLNLDLDQRPYDGDSPGSGCCCQVTNSAVYQTLKAIFKQL